jgi:simple sugar transport system permease protein
MTQQLDYKQPTTQPPPSLAPRPNKWHHLSKIIWPVAALGVILLYNLLFTPGFFHIELRDGRLFGSLVDVLKQSVPVMILSAGMTLVIATGGVDLSVGAVMAMAGALAANRLALHDSSLLAAILLALGLAAASGLWNGALVAYMGIQPIVATLVLMVSGRGIAQLISDGQIIPVDRPGFDFLANGALFGLPFPVTLAAVTYLAIGLLTRKTALGLFVESVGNNPIASRFAGVNARLVKLMVYVLCALCAGGAGLIAASNIRASDANNVGLYLELDAILAVLIGGTSLVGGRFTLLGSIVGTLIIQTTTTMILTRGVAVEVTLLVKAVIVVVVALFQAEKFRTLIVKLLGRGAN